MEIGDFDKLVKEYDAAPDEFGWEKDHPIFQMAEENDIMKKALLDESFDALIDRALQAADREKIKVSITIKPK